MRTYIYTERPSPVRGMNVRITAYRIKHNRPHLLGHSDHNTASWKGAEPQTYALIHEHDGVPFATREDGSWDTYKLRGLLYPSEMYEDNGQTRNAVRVFGI